MHVRAGLRDGRLQRTAQVRHEVEPLINLVPAVLQRAVGVEKVRGNLSLQFSCVHFHFVMFLSYHFDHVIVYLVVSLVITS